MNVNIYMKEETKRKIDAIQEVVGRPRSRIIADMVDKYYKVLPAVKDAVDAVETQSPEELL